jgi:hypothetical protein
LDSSRREQYKSIYQDSFAGDTERPPDPEPNYKLAIGKPADPPLGLGGRGERKKLVSKLFQQIDLDARFRDSKEKFHNFKSADKWRLIKDKISTFGVILSDS